MPNVMPHDKARARVLRSLMNSQESDAGGKEAMAKAKFVIKGSVTISPIYQFRLSDLYYNKSNGRVKAEVAGRWRRIAGHSKCLVLLLN